jgi:outer membrane protein insertion porin family
VRDIKVEGLLNLEPDAVTTHMATQRGDRLSLRRLREDIHNLYATGGFESVDILAESTKKKDEVDLVVVVKERLRIREIVYKGNEKKKAKKFVEGKKLSEGKAMDPALLAGDIENIKKVYREDGYTDVTVLAEPKPNEDGKTLDLIFNVNEGRQIKVAQVVFEGVQSFSERRSGKMKGEPPGQEVPARQAGGRPPTHRGLLPQRGLPSAVVASHEVKPSEDA